MRVNIKNKNIRYFTTSATTTTTSTKGKCAKGVRQLWQRRRQRQQRRQQHQQCLDEWHNGRVWQPWRTTDSERERVVGVVEVEEDGGRRRKRRFASSLWIFFFLQRLSHIVNIVVCSSFVCERDAASPAWPTLPFPSPLSLSLAKLRLGLKWKQTAMATNGIGIRSHEECSTHTYIHVQAGEHM